MGILSLRKKQPCVGVDIGSGAIKIAVLRESREKIILEKMGISEIPVGVFQGGLIAEIDTLADILKALWDNLQLGNVPAATAIPGKEVMVETPEIELDRANNKNFYNLVKARARDYIQYPIDELYFDCEVIALSEPSARRASMMLLTCVKKAILDDLVTLFRKADINLSIVDVTYYALFNGFERLFWGIDPNKTIALIDVGSGSTDIIIIMNGVPRHCRSVIRGIDDLVFQVADEFNLPIEDVQRIFRGHKALEGSLEQHFRKNVSHTIEQWFGEVRANIDYLRDFGGVPPINEWYLCGGPACMDGFNALVEKYMGLGEYKIYNPLEGVTLNRFIDPYYARTVGPQMGVALGLALRTEGDKKV